MARNDPVQLLAEADAMMKELRASETSPSAEDNLEPEEELVQEAPLELEDTVESTAEEAFEEESQTSGEDSDAAQQIEKAERAMKGAQAKMTQATQEAADLRRQVADLTESVSTLKSQLLDEQRNSEVLSQVREEYPDVAGPLLDEMQNLRDRVDQQSELNSQHEQRLIQERQAQAAQEHFERIRKVHSDLDSVVETSDWALWLEQQDQQIHGWVDSGSSNDVIAVLDKFKTDMGIKPATPQEQALARAKEVAEPRLPKARKANVSGERKSWTVDDIVNMPLDEFEKHKSEILEAQAAGAIRR